MDIDRNLLKLYVVMGVFVFGLLIKSILASGKPESYYFQQEAANGLAYYCVYADTDWRFDSKVFCSEDISKVIMINLGLNAQNNKGEIKETPKKLEIKEESL